MGSIGGRLVPLNSKDIRMEWERVEIRLRQGGADVKCWFNFRNEGKTRRVRVGFPQQVGEAALHRFRCLVDSKPVKVYHRINKAPEKELKSETDHAHPYFGWYWWWMDFPAGARKQVFHSYYAESTGFSTGDLLFEHALAGVVSSQSEKGNIYPKMLRVGYILRTGATWKGKIGRVLIEVDFSALPKAAISASPKGFHVKGKTIRWDLRNVEPETDVSLYYVPRAKVTVTPLAGDDLRLDASECLRNGQVYVPVSKLAQGFGYVQWDAARNQATLRKEDSEAVFRLGARAATVNGREIKLAAPCFLSRKGEFMAPLRVLCDGFGLSLTVKSLNDQRITGYSNYYLRIHCPKRDGGVRNPNAADARPTAPPDKSGR